MGRGCTVAGGGGGGGMGTPASALGTGAGSDGAGLAWRGRGRSSTGLTGRAGERLSRLSRPRGGCWSWREGAGETD
eukprot:11392735-Alexandrium_andersonii.AAC.1